MPSFQYLLSITTGSLALGFFLSGCDQPLHSNNALEPLTATAAHSLFEEHMPEIENCLRKSRAFYLDFEIYTGARDYPVFDTFTANIYQKVEVPSDIDAGIYVNLSPLQRWQSGDMQSPLYLVSGKGGHGLRLKVGERLSKIAPRRNTCVQRVLQNKLQQYSLSPDSKLALRFMVKDGKAYILPLP